MRIMHNRSGFADKQIIRIQEAPEHIPEGETPHTQSMCTWDTLVDVATPNPTPTPTPYPTPTARRGVRCSCTTPCATSSSSGASAGPRSATPRPTTASEARRSRGRSAAAICPLSRSARRCSARGAIAVGAEWVLSAHRCAPGASGGLDQRAHLLATSRRRAEAAALYRRAVMLADPQARPSPPRMPLMLRTAPPSLPTPHPSPLPTAGPRS